MEGKAAVSHVYVAINAIQSDISRTGVSKDKKNQQQGYQFRGIDDIYNALAPLLATHKLCVIPMVIKREQVVHTSKSGTNMFYVAVEVEYQLISAVDGSMVTAKTFGEAMDSADKATNKAMSAAFKYLAVQTFCIPVEGQDADADTPPATGPGNATKQPPWAAHDPKKATVAPAPAATIASTEQVSHGTNEAASPAAPEAPASETSVEAPKPSEKMAVPSQKDAIMRLSTIKDTSSLDPVDPETLTFKAASALIKQLNKLSLKKEAAA